MEAVTYQFEDFLMSVDDRYRDFVITVHEKLLQEGCKLKVGSSKTNLFSVKYTQGRRGIFNFMLRKKGLKASVYAGNFAKYPDVLNRLPAGMVDQIANAAPCKNLTGPKPCSWAKCSGYDIPIGDERYPRCAYSCFQFDVNTESMSALLALLESELQARKSS